MLRSAREDNDLVRLTLDGDRAAFEELLDRYEGKVYNVALRITGNREDAMDATQEAFLRAYKNLGRFDPTHRFFSWIYRIGINQALNVVERRKRTVDVDAEIPEGGAGPERRIAAKEAGRELQRAIAALKPDYRTVIVLRHFQELSYDEISEVIDVPVKTVKSRLFTARRDLRLLLAGKGLGPPPA